MATDLQQQLASSTSLYDAESLKAFNQMYNSQNPYGTVGSATYPNAAAAFPFFAQHFAPYSTPNASSFSPSSSSSSSSSTSSQHHPSSKKKPVPVPSDQKDEYFGFWSQREPTVYVVLLLFWEYYERRRRNNESARKSRDARKKQDTDNGVRVVQLEAENQHLKAYMYQLYHENMMMKQQLFQKTGGGGANDLNFTVPTF